MFREISKVEAANCLGDTMIYGERPDGYCAKLAHSELLVWLPKLMPVSGNGRPFLVRETAYSYTDPELSALIHNYPGVECIDLYSGIYDGEGFLLTEPLKATHLLLALLYDVECNKELRADFAREYNAQWYFHDLCNDEEGTSDYLFCDYWIIPRTPEFDQLLQRHDVNCRRRLAEAHERLINYDAYRNAYRQYLESELLWRIEDLGWKIYLYDIEAYLYYLDGNGVVASMLVRYDKYGIDALAGMIYIAEELAENSPDESADQATADTDENTSQPN